MFNVNKVWKALLVLSWLAGQYSLDERSCLIVILKACCYIYNDVFFLWSSGGGWKYGFECFLNKEGIWLAMKKSFVGLKIGVAAVAFCVFMGLSCHAEGEKNEPRRPAYWPLNIKDYLFDKIELALTQDEQMQGLMERESLPEGGGMLFVSDTMSMRSFWMKNCRMDMDLIYMDAQGVVVSVHRMRVERPRQRSESEEAYCSRLPTYDSGKPVQFVLELASGQVDFLGLQEGDKIDLGIQGLLELYKRYK